MPCYLMKFDLLMNPAASGGLLIRYGIMVKLDYLY